MSEKRAYLLSDDTASILRANCRTLLAAAGAKGGAGAVAHLERALRELEPIDGLGSMSDMDERARRHVLVKYMSDLSETHWAATWMSGWEDSCRPGEKFYDHENLILSYLNAATGGWWPSSYEEAAEYLHAFEGGGK